MGYQAVRDDRWKLIHYIHLPGMDELYDLKADPFELHNRIEDPDAQDVRRQLQVRLKKLLEDSGKGVGHQ
jgi:arylsulfatase A-like enzyme